MDGSFSSLLCQESETRLDEELVEEDTFINFKNYDGYEDGYMEMFFERETCHGFKRSESLVFGNWVKCARLEAITWILRTRAAFGFRFQTAYLSMIYFDRFLSRRSIDSENLWAIRLLSVACLSLAAKMDELKVPVLSEYLLEDYNFDSEVIQRMELLVLSTLEWRMCSITPFAFLYFFINKFYEESPPSNIVSRTVQIILAIMREVNLMGHRPSAVAAAAALLALDDRFTRRALELKMNSISHRRFLEVDDVFSCYNMMRREQMEILKIPKAVNSSDLLPTQSRPIDVIEKSSVTSAVTDKRRKLTFSTCDQSYGIPDDKLG
ncbi:cyclin-D5-1-like [Juglans microcarpa x Juglans regia]|uniref:cyclin-D5-1-like n=1 Tax=Juglans microcarpa x Juglans regia TaxID=2249226 RepID=UPI001B7E545A|nr:cyclin-D5-1-like [Juglans microcarpa x Juglans regia]